MKIYVRWHVPGAREGIPATYQALKLQLELKEHHTFPEGTIPHVSTLTREARRVLPGLCRDSGATSRPRGHAVARIFCEAKRAG